MMEKIAHINVIKVANPTRAAYPSKDGIVMILRENNVENAKKMKREFIEMLTQQK